MRVAGLKRYAYVFLAFMQAGITFNINKYKFIIHLIKKNIK